MKKKLLILCSILLSAASAWAVMAKPGPIRITEADGTERIVYLHGDQHFHYMTDETGQWVEMKEGFLQAAQPLTEEQIAAYQTRSRMQKATNIRTARPLNIAPRGLIILVNFSDVSFRSEHTPELMKEMFTSEHYDYQGATGSARQYFHDQSMGQYNPQFDVVGPVTLSRSYAYYGENDGNRDVDINAGEMVVEACRMVDNEVDFTQYDNNNDGWVDFVYIVYAGRGENDGGSSNTVWPHTSSVASYYTSVDGKVLSTYACSSELMDNDHTLAGVGTFCHEFSHVLGLPDLYNTGNNDQRVKLLGNWDLMCSGSYNNSSRTPAGLSSYERFFLGWLQPQLMSEPVTVELQPLNTHNEACIFTEKGESNLQGNDPNPGHFFMVENRQKTGWDRYLPGHGMLITEVTYTFRTWADNTVNNVSTRMGVDIIEADGISSGVRNYYGKQGDAFPYQDEDYYTPFDGFRITRITEEDGIIRFLMNGGDDFLSTLAEEHGEETYGEDFNQVVGLYNMAGQRLIATPPFRNLAPGFYIVGLSNGKKTKGVKIIVQ